MTFRIPAGAAFLAVSVLACASPSAARDMVLGVSLPSTHGVVSQSLVPFIDDLAKATKGSLSFKLVPGAQVVTLRTAATGITKRIIDAGLVVPVYDRKTYPNSNVLFDMQGFHSDPIAVAGAALETVMLNCPECLDDWKKANQVYLSGYSVTPFVIMCKNLVPDAGWLKGKKIRVSGANGRFAKAAGAVTVNIPPEDGVQALERGALDCTIGAVSWLTGYGYIDVVKQVVDFPLGAIGMLGLVVINRDAWNEFTPEQRKAVFALQPIAAARATVFGYVKDDERVREIAEGKGIVFKRVDLDGPMKEWLASEEKYVPQLGREMGAKNPEQVMATYLKMLTKWEKLSAEIGTDVDKLAAALKTHIYDKVDLDKL